MFYHVLPTFNTENLSLSFILYLSIHVDQVSTNSVKGVFESLADVAKSFTDGRVLAEKNIADLDKLCVYDLGLIQRAMGILMDDVEIVSNSRRGSLARITSGKSRDRQTQSNAAKSTESNEKANANGDPSDACFQSFVDSARRTCLRFSKNIDQSLVA